MQNKNDDLDHFLDDYSRLLVLMRVTVSRHFDVRSPRAKEFHDALELAWTAGRLLAMEISEPAANEDFAEVA